MRSCRTCFWTRLQSYSLVLGELKKKRHELTEGQTRLPCSCFRTLWLAQHLTASPVAFPCTHDTAASGRPPYRS
jgi:hypothetical protein